MPEDFPDLKSGDEIEPRLFNIVYKELRRWRKARGDGMVNLLYADSATSPPLFTYALNLPIFIQLTGTYSSGYPWQEVNITTTRGIQTSGVTGTTSNDPAFELNGDTTLTNDGTVYQAARSRASGELIFDGKH